MAVSINEIIYAAIGFVLVAILAPIGMSEVVGANTTGWQTSVVTIFQTLLPVMYIVGAAIYFIPKMRQG